MSQKIINKKEEQELLEVFKFNGRKLGFLLAESNMPDEVKASWFKLLPEMSIEQIEKLVDVLEARFLNGATSDVDMEYMEKIRKTLERYEQEDEEDNEALVNKLKDVENLI